MKTLQTPEEIQNVANRLKAEKIIAFDTEFIRESSFYPIVELIQVATLKEAWVIDAAVFKKPYPPGPQGSYDPALNPLMDVLTDSGILKIVHAAQGDQECLYTSFGKVASPVLDTAVAASLCGYGDNIGLARLMKSILGIDIPKGHARTDWSVRPLPEPMFEYAIADVRHLVELGQKLIDQLGEKKRKDWALTLSSRVGEAKSFEVTPEEMALRMAKSGSMDPKTFGALVELLIWREGRIRELNIPRRWLADDSVIIDLARTKPKSIEHLASFRGLSKGEIRSQGQIILDTIERGLKSPRLNPPEKKRPKVPTETESLALDLIRCYLAILAEQEKVAVRHLATAAQLLPLLREEIQTPQDLIKHGVLTREATTLIGDDLLKFLHGNLGLKLLNRKIHIVED